MHSIFAIFILLFFCKLYFYNDFFSFERQKKIVLKKLKRFEIYQPIILTINAYKKEKYKTPMKLKIRIHTKILIIILSTTVIIFVAAIGYVSFLTKDIAFRDATRLTNTYATGYANIAAAELNIDIGVARSLARSFQGVRSPHWSNEFQRTEIYKEILNNVLAVNNDFISVWVNFELNKIDSSYFNPTGCLRCVYYRNGEENIYKEDITNIDGDVEGNSYTIMKQEGGENISDPFFYSYTNKESDEVLETSITIPIMDNGEFIGAAGIDILLNKFQKITDEIKPYDKSYAFLVANNGNFVAYPHRSIINTSIAKAFHKENSRYNLISKIKNGQNFSFISKTSDGSRFYISIAPVNIGATNSPWAIGIVVPVEIIMQDANRNFIISIAVGAIGLILLTLVIWFTSKNITRPLQLITKVLNELDKGIFDTSYKLVIDTKDEIGEMATSVNRLINGLNNTSNFASQVGEGNLEVDFELLSDQDMLGNALLEMRKRLREAKEEEQRRSTLERRQNWATNGIAKFGEILRQIMDNMEEFSYNVVSNLVKYMDVVQGGIFLLNDNDSEKLYLELVAAYAYDRRKYMDKIVYIGEDLVGRCFQECETIYITDVPVDYLEVTSGLGDEKPSSILIVPLKVNEKVFGVVELASFNEIQKYQIEFVEKIGEMIAATVSNVKISVKTNLLLEETQKQSAELSYKEEQMRQNMEEMVASQEESARRENELHELWASLDTFSSVTEFNRDGKILNINEKAAKILGKPQNEIIGKKHSDFSKDYLQNPALYKMFWDSILAGATREKIVDLFQEGERMWLGETYTPIKNSSGKVYKILCLGINLTDTKTQEQKLLDQITILEKRLKSLM